MEELKIEENIKKPKTNAQRQQEWRERQKLKMGEVEYNKAQALRHKKKYDKMRKINKEDDEEDIKEDDEDIKEDDEEVKLPKLKPVKKRVQPIIKRDIKDISKNIYISFIKKFYKHYTNKELDNDNDIIKAINNEKFSYKNIKADFNFLIDKFEDIINTYTKKLNLVYAIFARIRGLTPFINKLYPYQIKLQELNEDKRQRKVVPKEKIDLISFDRDDILSKLQNPELKYGEKIIYGLLFLIPPRRYDDYKITKISETKPNEKSDDKYNYYYQGKIYIYNCKSDTRTLMEQQQSKIRYIVDVPDEINEIIDLSKPFILGREYTQAGVSKLLANATYKIYGITYNMTEIRRIKITEENDKGLNYYERKALADAMNHSLAQQSKYVLSKVK